MNFKQMKKRIYRLLIVVCVAGTLSISFFSCEEMLDAKPDQALEPEQAYRNRFDADAAVIGVYGKFLALAEHYMILNELRADLMDVTANADLNLREINGHRTSAQNPYTNPKPFYELILYCNDVLKNFDTMLADSKLLEAEYNERYADIATLRSWLYLQVAIHWGQVPYITEPFQKIDDLKDLGRFPKLSLQQMVTELITYMESLPTKEAYSATTTLNTTIDGYNTRTFFINKKCFLGDLYLWNGDYLKAATIYKDVMMTPVPGVDFFDSYRVKYAEVATNNDLAIGYVRDKEQDYNSLINNNTQGWKSMFIRGQDALYNSEWIWVLPFDSRFKQSSPYVDLFSNAGGKYLLRPSQVAMDLWNSQVQRNGFTFDQRGRFTYALEGGQPVIKKHIYNYDPLLPLERTGKWFLNRAALLHLRFAEAANRDNKNKVSWAFLNPGGIRTIYDDPRITDVTKELDTFLPYPYDFAARATNVPFFRDTWHRHDGVRGRAYVSTLTLDSVKYFNMSSKNVVDAEGLKRDIEDKLIAEAALELAYEGNRWQDLLRIAIRRNQPAFLADKIYLKLQKSGQSADAEQARAKLLAGDWFLPFTWE
jgi:hypothetical protein